MTNQAHSPMPPISEQWAVAGLFGLFGEDLTHVVDKNLGGDWAENDEILALLALRHEPPPTTRHLAQVSGMNRRTVSRMVARLRRDDIVVVGHSPTDRRSVTVGLTDHGRSCFGALAEDVVTLFETHRGTAAQICESLGCDRPAVVTGLDPLTLLEQLVTAGADLVRSIQPPADRQSLSGSQRTALIRIASGEAVRPVDLGPTLGVSRSGVAYVLDQLCHKGLVAAPTGRGGRRPSSGRAHRDRGGQARCRQRHRGDRVAPGAVLQPLRGGARRPRSRAARARCTTWPTGGTAPMRHIGTARPSL